MFSYLFFFLCLITAVLVHFFINSFFRRRNGVEFDEPPSPPALPFIGHLHLMGPVAIKSFQSLACRYGPLLKIRLGASKFVLASNAAVAKEIFRTHELCFLSKPEFGLSKYFIYRGSQFIMSPYNDYWRFMKKLCMTSLLGAPQLDKFVGVREEERIKLVKSVMKCCREGRPCDLRSELTTLTNDSFCRMAMSTRCSEKVHETEEVKEIVHICVTLAGKASLGDVLGPLKVFDFSGTAKKLWGAEALNKYDRLVERIIKEHEDKAKRGFQEDKKDLLDILLETYADPTAEVKLSKKDIKSFLLDLFVSATDTAAAAMQWAMGELINNPEAFKKLRDEINTVVGPNRLVKESDVQNLPYLQAVIKETLRLYPSAPLIIRECTEDCRVNGFVVKAKTRMVINVFALMRDPESYTNPDEFIPERFLESSDEKIGEHQMEFKSQNFRYLPFGSGRRGCPGASLAMLVMHAAVGSLVQCFDWRVKDGDKVDLSMGSGFVAGMARPLVCYPIEHFNPF
ncbi:3,9-dihydroxypterocarpan 6A-monooxygenase-like [Tripterygium wilfordii]|uniref:3,9-dihydroxypterocarpan 6A-monooxygenase-like n=1 Tax=Tripterygium wilfordii TaxID=458696 RepID=UPI0018F855C4|nr:3,9-dihydroxypterocarpan 6A-monooxygenase-like [Tripterygium wilfordii]